MTFSSLVGERLKEARKALGLNQSEIAEAVGVTREYWGRCERGASVPGGEVLAALAGLGVNVNHVLTGQPVPAPAELPRQEQEWLALYRNSSEEVRAALKAAGNELTKPAKARSKAA